jgi:endonuclease G, mitochondrial
MSKTTLAIIAAASAATGASITVFLYSSQSKRQSPPPNNLISRPPPTATTSAPLSLPGPSRSLSGPVPIPTSPVNPSGILQYGFPGPFTDLHTTPSHLSTFNRALRNPHFVAEHITPASLLLNNGSRRQSTFYEDATLPPQYRAKLTDYARSGYDRGHQVPAADAKWSQEAMDSTFVLTNMCPQVGEGFNRDYWAHLEEFCRDLTKHYPSVRIVTGPLYLPKRDPVDQKWRVSYEVIGSPPNVAVPTHFYKVIYGEESAAESPTGMVALGAFVLPNAEIPNSKSLGDFEVPVEAVERASGLSFVEKLPIDRQKRLCGEVRCEILVREFDRERKVHQGQQRGAPVARVTT